MMGLDTMEMLKSLNGYDISFTEKRFMYFFFSKRSSKASRLRYRILYKLEDIFILPKDDDFVDLDSFSFPVLNVGHNILEMIKNRYRTVVYLPSGKVHSCKKVAPCLIEIISLG